MWIWVGKEWIFFDRYLHSFRGCPFLQCLSKSTSTKEEHEIIVLVVEVWLWPHPYALGATRSRRVYFELYYSTNTPSGIPNILLRRQLLPVLIFPTKLTNPTGSLQEEIISIASCIIYIFPFGFILMSCMAFPETCSSCAFYWKELWLAYDYSNFYANCSFFAA